MNYWLMKSEPNAFSVDDLAAQPNSPWDGVRNYQARNFIRQMQPDDLVLFYHSSCKVPAVVGIAKVTSAPYPDATSWDPESPYYDPKSSPDNPRWSLVEVSLQRKLASPVTLESIKQHPELTEMGLRKKGQRLSVMPVAPADFETIVAMGSR